MYMCLLKCKDCCKECFRCQVYERLAKFPLQWFVRLFSRARDKSVRPQVGTAMIYNENSGTCSLPGGHIIYNCQADHVLEEGWGHSPLFLKNRPHIKCPWWEFYNRKY